MPIDKQIASPEVAPIQSAPDDGIRKIMQKYGISMGAGNGPQIVAMLAEYAYSSNAAPIKSCYDWKKFYLDACKRRNEFEANWKVAEAERDRLQEALRREFWLQHGHFAELYGDDGEMQCSHVECREIVDYKRADLEKISGHVAMLRQIHARAALVDPAKGLK